jgi:ABC-2 type transport system ATP-binding protein
VNAVYKRPPYELYASPNTAWNFSAADAKAIAGLGFDVVREPQEVRTRIGLAGQFAAVDENLSGLENLRMIGQLNQLTRRSAKLRANELLEVFELTAAAKRTVKTYSGGMRRRLDLAAALVNSPPVLFLDEPTTGLDPYSRQSLWQVTEELVGGGTTVLLTTQYLEEADRLAHLIGVLDGGRMIAEGTADSLKDRLGGAVLEVVVASGADLDRVAKLLLDLGDGGTESVDPVRGLVAIPAARSASVVVEAASRLETAGIAIDDIALRRPSLDDVFLSLTGHRASADEEADPVPAGRRRRAR